jgi:predicted dehydrogenase
MSKYNCLIIGAGGQGALADAPGSGNEHKIISFAHAFKEHPGFELIGFIDKDMDKAIHASETWYSIDAVSCIPNILAYQDCIAVVATPDDQHYEILKELAEYPLKLAIVEKPLCTDLAQAREIVELYRARGIPLMVNYTRRFIPYYRELREKWNNGESGSFIGGNFVFNRGWIHTGSHMIDFIRWFFGFGDDYIKNHLGIRQIDDGENYRIWMIDLFFQRFHWREERIGDQPVWDYYDRAMWHVVDNAYNFLEGRESLKCTGEDTLRTLEICFEMMEGAKTEC